MRSRVRRLLGLTLLAVALAAPSSAFAKTLHVNWREQKILATGGAITFHVTKIVVTPTSWAATVEIANGSPSPLDVYPQGLPPIPNPIRPFWRDGFALLQDAVVVAPQDHTRHHELWQLLPTSSKPALPRVLAADARWSGTFGGTGKLKQRVQYRLGFGIFVSRDPDTGGASILWVTDHTFTL